MKEVVVLSGKGGTGKTSLTAAFATLAQNAVVADCDVDASNLHLLLHPVVRESEEFTGGHVASIREEDCTSCGLCATLCRFGAVSVVDGKHAISHCEGCGVCVEFCPSGAIDWTPSVSGAWMVSDCAYGPMVHARLRPGAENSGKLVSKVRDLAREQARFHGRDLVLIDGPPGIGCPVIASLAGVDAALIVAEPTPSGIHDLERILELTGHFGIDTRILVNKSDLNGDLTRKIRDLAEGRSIAVAGILPYSPLLTRSQVEGLSIVLWSPESEIVHRIEEIWKETEAWLRS